MGLVLMPVAPCVAYSASVQDDKLRCECRRWESMEVGHHHVPRKLYEKLPLQPKTREVFEKATTGHPPILGWHNYNHDYRVYSDAVEDLVFRYMKEQNIRLEQMTPDQARAVLRAVAASDDPRIQNYREVFARMRMIYRILRRLRSGD